MDIVENVEVARDFVDGMDFTTFASDRRTTYAVSEASRRLDQETRDRHADLPWREIASVGNVYRHACDAVDLEMVWQTVTEGPSELLAACRAELAPNGGAP